MQVFREYGPAEITDWSERATHVSTVGIVAVVDVRLV
jgi:hypothetical protein